MEYRYRRIISEESITNRGIRLHVRAAAAVMVGDDPASVANAARGFLSEQDKMETLVGRVFAGHPRSIIGGLTVGQITRERDRVAQEAMASWAKFPECRARQRPTFRNPRGEAHAGDRPS